MRPSGYTDPAGPRWPGHAQVEPRTPEWVAWVAECDAKRGRPVCGRKNRYDEPCENPSPGPDALLDYGRRPCRSHGDKSLKGIGSKTWKDGRDSRYQLRGRLNESYQRELHDLDYISHREDIALIKAMIDEQAAVLDDPTPCPASLHLVEPCPAPLNPADFDEREVAERRLLIEAWREREQRRQDEIGEWYQVRATAYRKFRELMLDKRRLTQTEVHRVKLAEDTLSGQQVRVFGQTVLDTCRTHVLTLVEDVRQTVRRELHHVGSTATAGELAAGLDVMLGPSLGLATMHQIQLEVTRTLQAARGENMPAESEMELLEAGAWQGS